MNAQHFLMCFLVCGEKQPSMLQCVKPVKSSLEIVKCAIVLCIKLKPVKTETNIQGSQTS